MKQAEAALFTGARLQRKTGRLRLGYCVDGLEHVVHAIYHDTPELPSEVWDGCVQELALACLVDLSTASMAGRAKVGFPVGQHARRAFLSAAKALRLEVVAERQEDTRYARVTIVGASRSKPLRLALRTDPRRVLLLMGGGKDSLYCYWLLRKAGYDVQCFYLTEARRTWQRLRKVYHALARECRQHRVFLDVNRRAVLDRRYGGHYISQFQIGELIAACLPYALTNRCRYIALGLERSSDEPMRYYERKPVNHQHQKSSAFIRLVNRHLTWRYHGAVRVVSPVHGMYDFGIYARFLRADQDLVHLQSSCGGANTHVPHCGRCEKCAFLAALLAGLSGDQSLYAELFPKDPLDKPALYRNWLSDQSPRPLTCAGLKDEVRLALSLAKARGWPSEVVQQWPLQLDGKRGKQRWTLDALLANHTTPLVPRSMARRLKPLLVTSFDDIYAALG